MSNAATLQPDPVQKNARLPVGRDGTLMTEISSQGYNLQYICYEVTQININRASKFITALEHKLHSPQSHL